jgi:hypothetical protein
MRVNKLKFERDFSRKHFGNVDFLKGLADVSPRCDDALRAIEAKDQSSLIVFLSDVWLDHPAVNTRFLFCDTGSYFIRTKF